MEDTDIMTWRTSTYSSGNGGNCVEVADAAGRTLVRDTKDRDGAILSFGSGAWAAFLGTLKLAPPPAPLSDAHLTGGSAIPVWPPSRRLR